MDRMAAVAVVPPQEKYKHFTDAILSYCKPKDVACSNILTIIFYSYSNSTQSKNQLKIKEVSQAVEFMLQVWCKKCQNDMTGTIF